MRLLTPNFPVLKTDFYHIDIKPATTLAAICNITIIPGLTASFAV